MSNDIAEGLSSAAACASDKEVDPYWWNQSTSSKNLMDSADDGLWDGLFQEANSSHFGAMGKQIVFKN
uniref:Uncharacterized protein n=1 Tax=Globodera rostochiensis TaxID=31243 RepID=A0A914I026_GLORO